MKTIKIEGKVYNSGSAIAYCAIKALQETDSFAFVGMDETRLISIGSAKSQGYYSLVSHPHKKNKRQWDFKSCSNLISLKFLIENEYEHNTSIIGPIVSDTINKFGGIGLQKIFIPGRVYYGRNVVIEEFKESSWLKRKDGVKITVCATDENDTETKPVLYNHLEKYSSSVDKIKKRQSPEQREKQAQKFINSLESCLNKHIPDLKVDIAHDNVEVLGLGDYCPELVDLTPRGLQPIRKQNHS